MKRLERTFLGAKHVSLSDEARRELDALDAALTGEKVAAEHARLAELAVALREMRPRARDEFVHALDARAERGFRPARARGEHAPREGIFSRRIYSTRGALSSVLRRSLLLRPASALALAAIVALAVAVPLAVTGSRHPSRQPAGNNFAATPAESAPGVRADRAGTAQPTPAAPVPAETEKSSSASAQPAEPAPTRLIERTATLDVGVAPRAVESSAQRVFTLVSAYGGYVRQSSVSSGEPGRGAEPLHGEEGERGGASFDIRVPSANLSGAIAALAHLGHVRSETNTTNDLTDQHSALRSALGEAQAERASLLARLRKATGEAEIALLRSRLHAVDERAGQLQGQLRALDQRVTYTSLALSLTAESSSGGAGAGDLTPGGAAHDAAAILDAALAVLVIAAAALVPLAALVIAAWVAFAATRRRLREQALDAG